MNTKSKLIYLVPFLLIFVYGCTNVYTPPTYQQMNSTYIIQEPTSNTSNTTVVPIVPKYTIPVPHPGNLTVYFIDVGQGDATFIVDDKNTTMLIDAGPQPGTVVSFIRNLGFNKINYFITTHPHADHIGGAADVELRLHPDFVYDNGLSEDTKAYRQYQAAWTNHTTISTDMILDFGDVYTEVIVPYDDGKGFSKNTNDNSVVVRMKYQNVTFLFTGDCESDCEERILDSDVSANFLKVGHHGSSTSSSLFFLQKVRPVLGVISVGTGNTYGHPAADTMERYKYLGIQTYRTDELGNIMITTDGWRYAVET